ncbi:MAG: hypothetical protein ACX931_02920 [Saccharospirillum sp.]
MTESSPTQKATAYSRTQMLVILLTPLLVMAASTALFFSGWLVPDTTVNRGNLVSPLLTLDDLGLDRDEINPERQWLWVQTSLRCEDSCEHQVYLQRQTHVGLGKNEGRVRRILLTTTPDQQGLAGEYPGMRVVQQPQLNLSDAFRAQIPGDSVLQHYIFVVDPLGNIPLYYTPEHDYKDIQSDMKNLLKLSTIG